MANDHPKGSSSANKRGRPRHLQYYVPPGCCDQAQSLLELDDLTEQHVLDFVSQGNLPPLLIPDNNNKKTDDEWKQALVNAYHERRREISDLTCKLWEGKAYVDDHGRLVPLGDINNREGDLAGLLPGQLPPLQNRNNLGNMAMGPLQNVVAAANVNNNDRNNNNNNINLLAPPFINNNIPFPLDQEEEERRWTEEEERDAATAIARAVERYQKKGIPDQDYVLLRVPPMERPERASLTFRRICFAVLAVVTAFICIMLQTIPLFPRDKRHDPLFDKLLYELLQVRHFAEHAQACPNLHRSPPDSSSSSSNPSWWDVAARTCTWGQWFPNLFLSSSVGTQTNTNVDCSDGVVHMPTKTVLVDSFLESSTKGEAAFWEPYVLGVNVSWFMPCHAPGNTSSVCATQQPPTIHPSDNHSSCPISSDSIESPKCFRGIHDNMISDHEVGETLRWGAELIQEGGDHFDLHTEIERLQELEQRLPTLLNTIRRLLFDLYHVKPNNATGFLRPVAFRISAVGPLDGRDVVPLHGSLSHTSNYLIRILNRQKYLRWIEKHKRLNELARYSLALPSARLEPFRDPCVLMADLEADPQFAIHTSVFLSNGAGRDFRGGVALFVDDHPSNANPRQKIQRGITIDGSRGRLVVSTGGLENRRCRLPTREGIRASLQIWWSCDGADNDNGSNATGGEAT